MTANQLRALRIVGSFPKGVTVAMLAAGVGVTNRTASAAAKALVKKGYVDQADDGTLTITPYGLTLAGGG